MANDTPVYPKKQGGLRRTQGGGMANDHGTHPRRGPVGKAADIPGHLPLGPVNDSKSELANLTGMGKDIGDISNIADKMGQVTNGLQKLGGMVAGVTPPAKGGRNAGQK